MNYRFDKKNIKTAIAVLVSVWLSHLLKLQSPFFAMIAVFFSMENTIYSSYKAGIYRILGTIIGAAVGVAFVMLHPNSAILCGLGTIAVISLCELFHIERTIPTASVVFAAIMLSLDNKNPINYSLGRVLDTSVGIAIAILISYIVFPKDNIIKIQKSVDEISPEIRESALQLILFDKKTDSDALRSELINSIVLLNTYKKEFSPKIEENSILSKVTEETELLRQILGHLGTISELKSQSVTNNENLMKLKEFNIEDIEIINKPDDNYDAQSSIVYNYHVGKLLDYIKLI